MCKFETKKNKKKVRCKMVYILWFILGLTAILLVVSFLRSLIETFAEQGYEAAERMFLIRLPILSVYYGHSCFRKDVFC